MEKNGKPHAVMVPWPAQGHVNPLMRFAKLLHSRGFHITFVHTEFNYNRLIRSNGIDSVKGLPDFKFETIPDGTPPPSNPDATQNVPLVCDSLRNTCFGPFKQLLEKLINDDDVPAVSCVIADGVMNFAIKAAQALAIPGIALVTSSAFSFVGYLHSSELIKRGIFPFKNDDYLTDGTLDTPVDWVTGLGDNVRLKDLPSFFQTTDPNNIMFHFMKDEVEDCLKSHAVIFNNFEEFEQQAVQAVRSKFKYTNTYSIGPLSLLEQKHVPKSLSESLNSSLWKQDHKVFEWLDGREPESVLYVNYGCVAVISSQHFQELAWGIANSKQPFLWIVRPDVVKDGQAVLSEEFLEETKDRETICGGVPVICWPFNADQQTNAYCACNSSIWGIGMEINPDVKHDQVSSQIMEMMKGEKGKQMRMKAQEWKRKADEATDVGGSAYIDFDMLIKKVILHSEN
ncbi:Udp-glycosyltransferase 85a7 [Thalictrum thalictroides]|uniref:Udp-glycosyltransferase 85a7 n=1 Tax=Thalictrum thalictroides TaxID=46969 RepID=A0A7J6WVS8_THATH|nr:Udp-glycosyltransferase 85a7 [Thalictrum thalictroides]